MEIKQIMSSPAVTCRPNNTLDVAARLMWEHDCGSIAVVRDDNTLVGMITDRDICMAALTKGNPLHAISVESAMARQVFSAHERDSVDTAERVMSDQQIRRLPVVDGDNHPIGLVSINDIARYAVASRKENGIYREVTKTMASICQPRVEHQTEQQTRARAEQPSPTAR